MFKKSISVYGREVCVHVCMCACMRVCVNVWGDQVVLLVLWLSLGNLEVYDAGPQG